jgi:hypothetical protein
MDFHERLKFFINSKELTVSAFEAKLGYSNASLSKAIEHKRPIGSNRIENILSVYPDLSSEWLLREHGPMSLGAEAELRKMITALEKVIGLNESLMDEYRKQLSVHQRKEGKTEKKH